MRTRKVCEIAGISKSTYYLNCKNGNKEIEDMKAISLIERLPEKMRKRAGSKTKSEKTKQRSGIAINRKRMARICRDHILVKSSVFHYEFEFIHPFEDVNGRIGRFWQSRLLSDWNPVFEYLPIENMIWENQADYYKAIGESTRACDSGIFVEYMLEVILSAIVVENDTVKKTD